MTLQAETREGGDLPRPLVIRSALLLCVFSLGLGEASFSAEGEKEAYREKRESMVRTQIASRDVRSAGVLEAMRTVPRHEFVRSGDRERAYSDQPLPIGHGQTISQPYIVALMTELLGLDGDDVVLEIGTGSGYQAAVLSGLVGKVYSIEIIEPLHQIARERMERLGYKNVRLRHGDGYFGWKEHAPYDAIIVTAAAEQIPPPLVAQLKPGGRMIIPVGRAFFVQNLVLVTKDAGGEVTTKNVLPVRFVPLTGDRK